MGKSYQDHFKDMILSMNLTIDDVPLIKLLTSFHEMCSEIRQRSDTKQFILISSENSYQDKIDDYFHWCYITESEAMKIIKKQKS